MAATRAGEWRAWCSEGRFGAEGEGKWAFGAVPAENEAADRAGESLEVGVQEFEMVCRAGEAVRDSVHVYGELSDLPPAFGGVG